MGPGERPPATRAGLTAPFGLGRVHTHVYSEPGPPQKAETACDVWAYHHSLKTQC